jgi:ABC-type proline/glycine betaine transport system ATPase subunit
LIDFIEAKSIAIIEHGEIVQVGDQKEQLRPNNNERLHKFAIKPFEMLTSVL